MAHFAGVDIGSTMTKVVIINETILASVIKPTHPEQRRLANVVMEEALAEARLDFDEISYIVATGYGRINVPFADKQITEISCHARGISSLLPQARIIIDIGGQDFKGIKVNNGQLVDFVMNDKCAAGTGRFLEVIAETLGIKLEDMGRLSLAAKSEITIANMCTVFAIQEVVTYLANGAALEDVLAGVHHAIATRVSGMVRKLKIDGDIALTGGGAKNVGLVKALEDKLNCRLLIPPEPLLTGAIGAALKGKDISQEAERSGLPLIRSRHCLQEAAFYS